MSTCVSEDALLLMSTSQAHTQQEVNKVQQEVNYVNFKMTDYFQDLWYNWTHMSLSLFTFVVFMLMLDL